MTEKDKPYFLHIPAGDSCTYCGSQENTFYEKNPENLLQIIVVCPACVRLGAKKEKQAENEPEVETLSLFKN